MKLMNLNLGTFIGNGLTVVAAHNIGGHYSTDTRSAMAFFWLAVMIAGVLASNHYAYRAGVISCRGETP